MGAPASVLPRSIVGGRFSPRAWLAVAGGLGCAVAAYAGLYPRFDQGSLRLVIAATSLPFGAAVAAVAVSARESSSAFARAIGLAVILGIASTVLPGVFLVGEPAAMPLVLVYGTLFGGPSGAVYGVPLAVLVHFGHRHHHTGTADGADHAARVGGVWLAFAAETAFAATLWLDVLNHFSSDEPLYAPAIVSALVALAGIVVAVRASVRIRRRAAWIARVRAGLEPAFRVRPREAADGDDLAWLGYGSTVIEWRPDAPNAYRTAALGTAVAVVSDTR